MLLNMRGLTLEAVQALKPYYKSSRVMVPPPKAILPTLSKLALPSNPLKNQQQGVILATVRTMEMAKGLCYYCDRPFGRGHKCTNRNTQLFLVKVPRDDEEELQEELLEE